MPTHLNTESRKQMIDLYYQKLEQLQMDVTMQTIETSFGDTNVIKTKANKKPPLILVHSFYSCAPNALEYCKGLEKYFQIYVIDVLGVSVLGDFNHLNQKKEDYQQWIYEILARLQVTNAYLVGISLGAFISLKALTLCSDRFKMAFLISPAGIIPKNSLQIFLKITIPKFLYHYSKKEKYLTKIKTIIVDNKIDSKYFLHSLTSSSNDKIILNLKITKRDIKQIQTPIHIIAAENDIFYSGRKIIKRAKKCLPTLQEVILLAERKHLLSHQHQEEIRNHILNTTKNEN